MEENFKNNAGAKDDLLVREMLGNVMHDLKTPLTAVRGYAQGIIDGVANTPERLNKYAVTIRNKAEDMSNLVDDIFFFSQIYQQNIQYDFQRIDVRDYLSECISGRSLDLETRKISLLCQFQVEADTQFRIDPERLKRVIYNIIDNSSKYIDTDIGILYVQAKETEDKVIICISDNGQGIEKEELSRIFERFYRTDRSRNSTTGGSGIGLSIAKKIIEDHKGRIWAESEFGQGTKISLELPKI